MGDKIGRIHLGRQDLSALQTRKMKGLKRGRDVDEQQNAETDVVNDDVVSENEDTAGDGVEIKRAKLG